MKGNLFSFMTWHLDTMDIRSQKSEIERRRAAFDAIEGTESYTLCADNLVIGCGGIVPLWEGVGEIWMVSSIHIERYKIEAIKQILTFLKSVGASFHRLQATVDTEDKRAVRFIEWLGFEREGTLRKYGFSGSDHYIYARIL